MDKKTNKKRKVILNVFTFICLMAVLFTTTACSGSRTGTEITFSNSSLEEADLEEESGLESEDLRVAENHDEVEEAREGSEQTDAGDSVDLEAKIYVHVCGAVERPGVYPLRPDSRVYEGIEAAGGLTSDADEAAVNQAGRVEDGQQIYVYTKEETEKNRENGDRRPGMTVEETEQASSKVNLNTAGKEELMTLTGIGEAKAQAIIDFRESNGSYSSVEEIMKIDGIKQGVFQKIKDDITI